MAFDDRRHSRNPWSALNEISRSFSKRGMIVYIFGIERDRRGKGGGGPDERDSFSSVVAVENKRESPRHVIRKRSQLNGRSKRVVVRSANADRAPGSI